MQTHHSPRYSFRTGPRVTLDALVVHEIRQQGLTRADLAARLGYVNVPKALRRLDHLMQYGEDPVLLPKLAGALGIDQERVEAAVAATKAERAEEDQKAAQRREAHQRATFRPHILIETECRIPQPIFVGVVAYERLKHIYLPEAIVGAPFPKRLAWARMTVARHYERQHGRVSAFGAIVGYTHRDTFDRSVTLDITGEVIDYFAPRPQEDRGWLAVKGHAIPSSVSGGGREAL